MRGDEVIPSCVLGIDSSTQSLSAVLVDSKTAAVLKSFSVTYKTDIRLKRFGLDPELMTLAPRSDGEADQPPLLFLASLEALFEDMVSSGVKMSEINVINISAQQHGHVYLSDGFDDAIGKLNNSDIASSLVSIFERAFSFDRAPIWKTSNTEFEANILREVAGGKEKMIRLTGSDSPLRFTGAVAKRVFDHEPGVLVKTRRLHLISSFISSVLSGNPDTAIDCGNASGTSLMDYLHKVWSPNLVDAAGLTGKLSSIESPLSAAGKIAPWFVKKFGFSSEAVVLIGSGDNPQTKVLVNGDLLSLGTSFVMMVEQSEGLVDPRGWGNAMYDGIGRPFLFGCRTNGALVWDRLRKKAGLSDNDFKTPESVLASKSPGSIFSLWQPDHESFPPSPTCGLISENQDSSFDNAYPGCVDSALSLLYKGSLPWLSEKSAGKGAQPLYVTGGPSSSKQILRRISAIWNRPVITIGTTGAALGAAAAALAFTGVRIPILSPSTPVLPEESDVNAYHRGGGYLDRIESFLAEKTR